MIEKTRKKFIFVTMLLLVVIFTGVLCGILIGTKVVSDRVAIQQLQKRAVAALRSSGFGEDHEFEQMDDFRTFTAICPNGLIATQSCWSYRCDAQVFSATAVWDYVCKIVEKDKYSGYVGTILFVVERDASNTVVCGIDRSIEGSQLTNGAWLTLGLGAVSLVLLYFVVCAFSKWIIRPISDAFDKQKRFVSDASHELKTPLTVINANADALKDDIGDDNKWVNNIVSQTERMNALVLDLLALAKLEEKSATPPIKFNLSQAISSTVMAFDANAFECGKSFDYDIAPNITYTGNENDVKQLVTILTDNAVIHSTEKGAIYVKLTFAKFPVLTVENDGKIEGDCHKVFERFYRGDESRNRSTGGSGLGLSIAKALCDKNKWAIDVTSSNGKVKFTVDFDK